MFFKKYGKANSDAYLVVGLGNVGKKYQLTRHNVGFMAIDYIAERNGFKIVRTKFDSYFAETNIGGQKVFFQKPTTFMNLSGVAISKAMKYYDIPPERVIVIFDDISLDPGVLRIRSSGSAGGHNGLKSIIEKLSSDEFLRIKVGIGAKPSAEYPLADYVLSIIPSADRKKIEARFSDILSAVELMVKGDISGAQSRFNG